MYVYKDQEGWDEAVKAIKTHLDEEPKPVKEVAKENIYVTDPKETVCFDLHSMFRGLFHKVQDLKKENDELKEKLQSQSGWLASKELQTNLLRRVEKLEKENK